MRLELTLLQSQNEHAGGPDLEYWVGSAAGWWIGAHIGIMTAFVVSMVGFGAGLWGARRFMEHLGM